MHDTALSLARLFEGFCLAKEAEGVSARTIEAYTLAYTALCRFLPPEKLADARLLSSTDLQSWALDLAHRGLAAATRDQRLAKAKCFFAWATREGFLPADVGAQLKRPRKDWQPDPLSPNEVKRLLVAAKEGRQGVRDFAIICVLLDSGMRAGELAALEPKHVDLRSGQIRLEAGTKNGKHRVVIVGKRAKDALWRWLMVRPADAQRLFVTEQGRPLDRNRVRVIVAHAGERAHIAGRCYPHRLRHTFAVLYLRGHGDAFSLQAILGHESMDTTRQYIKLAAADVAELYRSPLDALATQ